MGGRSRWASTATASRTRRDTGGVCRIERSDLRPVRQTCVAGRQCSRSTAVSSTSAGWPPTGASASRRSYVLCTRLERTEQSGHGTLRSRVLAETRTVPYSRNTRSISTALKCGNSTAMRPSHRTTHPHDATSQDWNSSDRLVRDCRAEVTALGVGAARKREGGSQRGVGRMSELDTRWERTRRLRLVPSR